MVLASLAEEKTVRDEVGHWATRTEGDENMAANEAAAAHLETELLSEDREVVSTSPELKKHCVCAAIVLLQREALCEAIMSCPSYHRQKENERVL